MTRSISRPPPLLVVSELGRRGCVGDMGRRRGVCAVKQEPGWFSKCCNGQAVAVVKSTRRGRGRARSERHAARLWSVILWQCFVSDELSLGFMISGSITLDTASLRSCVPNLACGHGLFLVGGSSHAVHRLPRHKYAGDTLSLFGHLFCMLCYMDLVYPRSQEGATACVHATARRFAPQGTTRSPRQW